MNSESNQSHVLDDIPVYLTGGLSSADRERFESHVAGCSECAAAVADASAMDESLQNIFANVRPTDGFEDRMIARFRQRTTRRTLHPLVRRAAIGVAATILIGGAGVFYQRNAGRLQRIAFVSTGQRAASASAVSSKDIDGHDGDAASSLAPTEAAVPDDRALQDLRASQEQSQKNKIETEQINYEVNKAIADAQASTAKGDYGAAETALLRAQVAIRTNTSIFTADAARDFDNQIAAARQANDAARARAEQEAKEQNDAGITARLEQQKREAHAQIIKTKADLRAQAVDLSNRKQYRQALDVVDQIATLDPQDEYATGVRPLLQSQYNFQQQRIYAGVDESSGGLSLHGRATTLKDATISAGTLGTASIPSKFDQNGQTTTLSGLNTYSGATTINGGTLKTGADDSASSIISGKPAQDGTETRTESGHRDDIGGSGQIEKQLAGEAEGRRGIEPASPAASPAPAPVVAATTPPAGKSSPDVMLNSNTSNWAIPEDVTKIRDYEKDEQQKQGEGKDGPSAPPKPLEVTLAGDANKLPAAQPTSEDSRREGGKEHDRDGDKTSGGAGIAPVVPSPPPTAPDESAVTSRKIIREGEMTFEVDSFDSTVMTIGKIVAEETGFVSTTDSDKLANGKVRGTVVVRVPPEHLDTLVLKLRGIGDLKSQKISAQDITKQYTDLESELRAARAMEERLLDIIKNGKGAVKDLLEAEKQLGVWREKIEHVEGEIRYDNNLVSLSTLSITLMERDIKAAASTSINEQVTMSLETDKVEQAYEATRQAIDNARGRITQSELKQFDAGQFGATIKAQLPPDQADAVIARIRQLDGRVANFQRERSQNSEGGSGAPVDASKVKHEDVTLALTIYNLANIAPRRTTTLTIVASDVDAAYSAILDQANKAGARVVSSNLNHPRPDQSNGTISISSASDKADALLATVRANGEILGQESSDNPDSQNVSDAKRGVIVQVISLASVQARQSETLGIASTDVPAAFSGILDALRATDARIVASQLNQQDPTNQTATIVFDISRTARPSVDAAIDKLGEVFSRNITRSPDTANTLDSKVHCELTLQSADVLPARQTTTLAVEVADVQKSVEQLLTAASELGGREIDKDISQDQNGRSVAHVIVEVPLTKADALSDQVESWGHRRSRQVTHDAQAPTGKLARGRLEVTLADAAAGLGGEETTWDAIRHGLAVSGQGLRWSVQMLVIGGCIVVPWILVIWVGWRLLKRRKAIRGV